MTIGPVPMPRRYGDRPVTASRVRVVRAWRAGPRPASVLVSLLLGLTCARLGPRLFGLGFLARDLALGVGLFLLRLALALQVLVAFQRARRFLHLALDLFGNAARGGPRAALFVSH